MPCFDLSGFTPMSEGVKYKYRTAWGVFEKVQAYDINISTLRDAGDKSKTYWQFRNSDERGYWIMGLSLHAKRYPTSNWNPPQKN
jgi:hypothetical protein